MAWEKDPNRPYYMRPPGQLGICVDVVDAQALDPKEFGSERFFELQLMDVLLEEFTSNVELYHLKAKFEERQLLDGVILEKFYKGIILSVAFDTVDALEELWELYESEQLPPIMQEFLITPEVLETARAKDIRLRTRMYHDDFCLCRTEILACAVPPISLETKSYDLAMVRKVREFQQEILKTVSTLRDDLLDLDDGLGELLVQLKRHIPYNVEVIANYKQLETMFKSMEGKPGVNWTLFERYMRIYEQLRKDLEEYRTKICLPLAQVHAGCESSTQNEVKRKLKELVRDTSELLTPEYDFSESKHPEWVSKIVPKEHKLLTGVVSVLPLAGDAVIDIDTYLDEYLSGVQVDLL